MVILAHVSKNKNIKEEETVTNKRQCPVDLNPVRERNPWRHPNTRRKLWRRGFVE